MHTFTAAVPEDMEVISRQIKTLFPDVKIWLLEGNLGAGKTTFVKAFCNIAGVKAEVTSPTFSLVHEYEGQNYVYHFDLYRLEDADELYKIGFEEYLGYEGYKLIEWPEIAKGIIDEPYLHLTFNIENKNIRTVTCRKVIYT